MSESNPSLSGSVGTGESNPSLNGSVESNSSLNGISNILDAVSDTTERSGSILDEMISRQINDLSDDSDYEEMPIEDLIRKLTKPPSVYMLPKVTESQVKTMTEAKQAYKQFVSTLPLQIQPYAKQSYRIYRYMIKDIPGHSFALTVSWYNWLRYVIGLLVYMLSLTANSWQLTIENCHRYIIRSDAYINQLLDDRS
jgi:hypothetical protein